MTFKVTYKAFKGNIYIICLYWGTHCNFVIDNDEYVTYKFNFIDYYEWTNIRHFLDILYIR